MTSDCLEMLHVGAGLDNGWWVRQGDLDWWKISVSRRTGVCKTMPNSCRSVWHIAVIFTFLQMLLHENQTNNGYIGDAGLGKRWVVWDYFWEVQVWPQILLESFVKNPCELWRELSPIFHMFWTGSFTDKPYTAFLSFLYTPNVSIHLHETLAKVPPSVDLSFKSSCCPHNGMFEELNPWSAPFLHHHFPDITHFKLWNFTEQLDSVPELKVKFKNSRGHKFEVPKLKHSDLATEGTAPLVQLSRREDIRHCGQIAHCKVHIMSLVWKSVSWYRWYTIVGINPTIITIIKDEAGNPFFRS